MNRLCGLMICGMLCGSWACDARAADREAIVRADRERVEATGYWIYNDLDAAYQEARASGKPILVVLRCLPCEECVQLDDDLVDNDPVIKPLLDQFVRVRVVGTNGLDLSTFQYDTDQSFAVFMLNADKTIYGRFGTRSHRTEWVGDVSLEGMARALEAGLEIHQDYPNNREQLAGKMGDPLEVASPEKYPTLRKHPSKLDYAGQVAKSCIHCHQIGEARRDFYWLRGEPIPEEILHPYPHPKSIGLVLDARYPARVKKVTEDSLATSAGLQAGDDILSMNHQPLVSMADVQWALNAVPAVGGDVAMTVSRSGANMQLTLSLPEGWRKLDDTSWRVSSWMMRRIAAGGLRLLPLNDDEKRELGVETPMAMRVANAGKYGPHATARKAGVRVDDVLIEFDGRTDFRRESDLFDHVNGNRKPGDKLAMTLLRNGEKIDVQFPVQK